MHVKIVVLLITSQFKYKSEFLYRIIKHRRDLEERMACVRGERRMTCHTFQKYIELHATRHPKTRLSLSDGVSENLSNGIKLYNTTGAINFCTDAVIENNSLMLL